MVGAVDVRRRAAPWTGIGRYVDRISRDLPTLMGDSAPTMLAGGGLWVGEEAGAAPSHDLGKRRKVLWEQVALPIWLRRHRPSFLHLPWYEGPIRVDVPLIVTIHDLDTLLHPTRYSLRFRAYYNELLLRYARAAHRIITVSETSARDIAQHLAAGDRTVVIPMAPSPEFFSADRARGRRLLSSFGVSTSKPVLLSASGTAPRKNLGVIARALDLLSEQGHETTLVVTLTSTVPPPLAATQATVVPVGTLSLADLADVYAACDISLSPSLYEGFGLSIVEAMAAGCPVIASAAGSHPEIAGADALFFPPADDRALAEQMTALLETPGLRAELAESGRRRAARYSWAQTMRMTADVYAEFTT